ncbi:MAG: hypothetical protein Q8P23_04080 [bacterium]|nr:hypothetical protein [bacterium]
MKTPPNGFVGALLLIIIALVLIGGGTYLYTQKNQESQSAIENMTTQTATTIPDSGSQTVDWNTYTNTKYGFVFKYPGTSILPSESNWPNGNENTITVAKVGVSELKVTIFPLNADSIQFKNVSAAWNSLEAGKNNGGGKETSCSKITMPVSSGYGYRCFSPAGYSAATVYYYFKKDDTLFYASMDVLGQQSDVEMADNIVGSFKFTK